MVLIQKVLVILISLILLVFVISCESDSITGTSTGNLKITVVDNNSVPVAGIVVKITGTKQYTKATDSSGQCYLSDLQTVSTIISIKIQGYRGVNESFVLEEGDNSKLITLEELQEFNESFEAGSFSSNWTLSGDGYWFITDSISYSGNYCAQSGQIQNYQECSMSITLELESETDFRFWYKLETDYYDHYFEFYVNGYQELYRSGNYDWEEYYRFLSPGTYHLTWTYNKQDYGYNSIGVWIDDIQAIER